MIAENAENVDITELAKIVSIAKNAEVPDKTDFAEIAHFDGSAYLDENAQTVESVK